MSTVLIVDDEDSFRRLAWRLLEAEGVTVVGEAADGASAVSDARSLRPEIVLLDVQLPDADGFKVAVELTDGADAPVVVMTSAVDAQYLRASLEHSPALGFIPKDARLGQALAALVAGQ
jgi:DNA-binding NarL/FixJ family response regulator